jgi:hypothetical protein
MNVKIINCQIKAINMEYSIGSPKTGQKWDNQWIDRHLLEIMAYNVLDFCSSLDALHDFNLSLWCFFGLNITIIENI